MILLVATEHDGAPDLRRLPDQKMQRTRQEIMLGAGVVTQCAAVSTVAGPTKVPVHSIRRLSATAWSLPTESHGTLSGGVEATAWIVSADAWQQGGWDPRIGAA